MYKLYEVKTKKELKEFINFQTKLYENNPYSIPLFYPDEVNHLKSKNNVLHSYCDAKLFYIRNKNGKMVGRVVGIINNKFNKNKNVKQVRFTRIDFLDDPEISKMLLNAVISWGKSRGMNELIGPIGFNDLDKQGMLVEGFCETDSFITFYNYPYYMKHMEQHGLIKAADWVEYEIYPRQVSYEQFEKVKRAAKFTEERFGYYLNKNIKRKDLTAIGIEMFSMYNRAFSHLYGFEPITDSIKRFYIDQVRMIINFDYCYLIQEKKTNKIIGFALIIPSLGKTLMKYKGKIGLSSLFSYMKGLSSKNEEIDFYFISTEPTLLRTGISTLIFAEGIYQSIKNNVRVAYSGPQLEYNNNVLNFWKNLSSRQNRRRRCYKLDISDINEIK